MVENWGPCLIYWLFDLDTKICYTWCDHDENKFFERKKNEIQTIIRCNPLVFSLHRLFISIGRSYLIQILLFHHHLFNTNNSFQYFTSRNLIVFANSPFYVFSFRRIEVYQHSIYQGCSFIFPEMTLTQTRKKKIPSQKVKCIFVSSHFCFCRTTTTTTTMANTRRFPTVHSIHTSNRHMQRNTQQPCQQCVKT